MRAMDVMTSSVIVATADTPVEAAAKLMAEHRVSGLPVVDGDEKIIGIVTEGDLLHRAEIDTAHRRRSWLFEVAASTEALARAYRKEHAAAVGQIMTRDVVCVTEQTPLIDIADLLERHGIKRVPVLRDGRLAGIVSRSNLVRALASIGTRDTTSAASTVVADQVVRAAVLREMAVHKWDFPPESVIVNDGVVHLWGIAASGDEAAAMRDAAAAVQGAKVVTSHLEFPPPVSPN